MPDISFGTRKKTWERRIEKAKKKHRPKLRDWNKDRFKYARHLEFLNLRRLSDVAGDRRTITVDTVSRRTLSISDFRKQYEIQEKPCIITDIPVFEKWSALENWNFDDFERFYNNSYFKVGEDDKGTMNIFISINDV